jgi:hypothetical protein
MQMLQKETNTTAMLSPKLRLELATRSSKVDCLLGFVVVLGSTLLMQANEFELLLVLLEKELE